MVVPCTDVSPFDPRPSWCLPAILGMHTLMSNQQYYEALASSTIVNKQGLNSKHTHILVLLPL